MADNVAITAGTGTTMATDDVGGVQYPRVKLAQGADGSATDVSSAAPLQVTLANGTVPSHAVTNAGTFAVQNTAALVAGTNNIGDVDVLTVPSDPFGANADAASATGSISAKLRGISTALGVTALDLGQGTGGSRTLRVAIDSAQLDGSEYETVAASQTTQTLGATGATGDYLREVLVIPATTSPGAVAIKDGSNTAITVFTGGATSVSNLVPFTISLGLTSTAGAWQVTTGSNVSAIGIGNFT